MDSNMRMALAAISRALLYLLCVMVYGKSHSIPTRAMTESNYYSHPFITEVAVYSSNGYAISQTPKLIISMLHKNTNYKQDGYVSPCE